MERDGRAARYFRKSGEPVAARGSVGAIPKIDRAKMPMIDSARRVRIAEGVRSSRVTDGREKQRLGDAAGLTQFGVNLTRLKPGAASALRHWHESEDEFVYVLEGEMVLIEDDGETVLQPGDAAGFKAGVANGHIWSTAPTATRVYLEIGTRAEAERAHYPDVDLRAGARRARHALLAPIGRAVSEGAVRPRWPTVNFKLDTDADGIALVTWDMPGRSMNVIDLDGDRGACRASSRRSRPTPRSRARSSPRARTRSAPAPTSPCSKA